MVGVPRSSATSPVMVGREAEAERMGLWLDALLDGRAGTLVISGEAGIGKTRLIDEALERPGSVVRVLHGDCLALGTRIPYLPFAEILRDLARQVPSPTLTRIIGPARAELARFLPEVTPPAGAGTEPRSPGAGIRNDELERLRLYEAFLRVAERIAAESPTVFVIEDVQWIDRASLELLAFLAHGLGQEHGASLIVSVRPEEVEDKDEVLMLLAELGRGPATERIELGPLDAEACGHIAVAVLGRRPPADLLERLHERSDGNPLFLEQLLLASAAGRAEADLPPKLRDLLATRLAQVPADVLDVLRVAAAAGRTIDDRLLARVSGLEEEQVRHAVRVAVDDGILIRSDGPDGPAYRFRHEILRAVVASQLLPTESRRIHAAFAEALAQDGDRRRSLSEIADHWDAAGDDARALPAHIEAGRAATAAFAFRQASEHLDRALGLWGHLDEPEAAAGAARTTLLGEAAAAAARAGDFAHAIGLVRELIAGGADLDADAYELARSSLRWYLWESGELQAALDEAEAVVNDTSAMPPRWRANASAHYAALLLYQQRTSEAQRRATEARDMAVAAEATEEQIMAEGVLGWCLLLEGDIDAGLAAIRRALDAAEAGKGVDLAGRYPAGAALAYSQLAAALELVGRLEQAHEVARTGVEVARRQGVARTFGSVLQATAARALFQMGRWDEVAATVAGALREGAVGSGRVSLLAVRALLAVARGDALDAETTLAEAEALVNDRTPIDVRRWLTAAGAEHALWRREPAVALARMAFLTDDQGEAMALTPGGQPAVLDASLPYLLALGARACADATIEERASGQEPGLSALARAQLEAALARARRRKALAEAWAGDLHLARAELERAGPSDARARARRWKTASDHLAGPPARPYAAAYARWRLAEAYLAARDGREAAVPILQEALEITQRLGALPLAGAIEGLARRARLGLTKGGDVPASVGLEPVRPYGLTAREAEVLALLSTGLSNQEIAERLFISPKTASVHVSNIYSKLDVESRVAAATLAHELGLDSPPAPLEPELPPR